MTSIKGAKLFLKHTQTQLDAFKRYHPVMHQYNLEPKIWVYTDFYKQISDVSGFSIFGTNVMRGLTIILINSEIFLVSKFRAPVDQGQEQAVSQFQPILYLILLAPFPQVQPISRLRQRQPKIRIVSYD